jgi:hypothetical protein
MQRLGEEVGMRRSRFVIPVFVFVVCCLISIGIFAHKRNEIKRMLDEAGRMGYPVVAVQTTEDGRALYITSINGGVISIPIKNVWGTIDDTCFTKTGELLLIDTGYQQDTVIWKIDLPYPIAHIINRGPIDLPFESIHYSTPSYGGQYELWSSTDEFLINDLSTGEIITGRYSSPPTWINGPETRPWNRRAIPSPDATAIVALQRYSMALDSIAVYDIPSGAWSEAFFNEDAYNVSVSNRADILGIASVNLGWTTEFIDGRSAQVIKTIQDVSHPAVGRRWASVYYDASFISRRPNRLILIDMEDNWREYSVEFSVDPFLGIAIYEPPPRGVEEMLEMRRHE